MKIYRNLFREKFLSLFPVFCYNKSRSYHIQYITKIIMRFVMKLYNRVSKKWMISLLCLSLLADSLFFPAAAYTTASEASQAGPQRLSRVRIGKNNGLARYQYVDAQGHPVSLRLSRKPSSSRKKAANLPSSYDSRECGLVTSIKDQGVTGSCWAFAAIKALESSSISQGLSEQDHTDYSENHLSWYAYHPVTDESDPLYGDRNLLDEPQENAYDTGGNVMSCIFTLANWWGAVSEDEAPFTADTKQDLIAMITTMKQKNNDFRSLSDLHLRESNCYDDATLEEKKEAVMKYGALDVSLYYDHDIIYETDDITSLYQTEYDDSDANHCVTIVGWDDDFDEFGEEDAPAGAWLIANSYGPDYNGMEGYFWASYYDSSLCEFYSLEGETPDTYDTNFQYDGNGWGEVFYDTKPITLANVFTNNSDTPKSIDAVTFYTVQDYQDYEIKLYRNQSGNIPTDGSEIAECRTKGHIERSGYHTVPLTQSISVAPGESFSVLLTYQANPYAGGYAYAPVEGESQTEYGYEFHSRAGQSYVYFTSEGVWYDQTAVDSDDETLNVNNACIKALAHSVTQQEYEEQEKKYALRTTSPAQTSPAAHEISSIPASGLTPLPSSVSPAPATPPSPIPSAAPSLSPEHGNPKSLTVSVSKITIGKREKVTIPVKTTPVSSSDQLTYQSSNDNIATVSQAGQITGRKKGRAKITITTENGLQKTLTVVVKNAPSKVRLTVKRTVLKKGQTSRITVRLNKRSASYLQRFSSSSPAVASVNAKGNIRARKKGYTWITLRCYNGKKGRVRIRVL